MAGAIVKVRDELAVQADAREARRLVADRKFEDAYQPLERWLKARPSSAEALFLTAKEMFAVNRTDQGFMALSELGPRDIRQRRSSVKRQSFGPAWEGTTKPSRYCDGSCSLRRSRIPEADEALAKCYFETFQLAQADSVIEKWIHDAPGDVKPHFWKLELGRKVKAETPVLIDIIQRILELDPRSDQAHLALAEAYLQNRRLEEAAREYAAVLELKPDTSAAYHGLGVVAVERGDEEGAFRNFERTVKLDPRNVRPLVERGKLEVGRGRLESGLSYFDQALSIDAGEPEVHYQRSLVLTRLGRTALARAERDTSARLRDDREHIEKLLNEMLGAPGDLDHQYGAARWLFEHGHPEEGLRWTEKILREQPRHAKTNRLLADYYEKKGSHGLANFYQLQAKSEP